MPGRDWRNRRCEEHEHRDRKPFGICTWQDDSGCADCPIGDTLWFLAAFTNSALLLFFFAVWDLLILDWLIFVTIQLSNLVPPIVYLTGKAIQMICFGHSLPLQENSL